MNVPKLRFKEFNEDYQLIELGKLVNYQKGFAFKSSDYQNFGTRIVRITDTTSNSIKENDAVFIDTDKAKNYYNYLLKENDIIISSVGSKPPLYDSMVGKVVLVPSHADKSLLNQNAIRFRAIKHNQRYLYNCLKQNTYTKFIESIMRGNANQRSIALDDLFKYVISLPNDINEENKIANLFSSLDKKIELQAKKIEALKLYKSYLSNYFFNPHVKEKIDCISNYCNLYTAKSKANLIDWKGHRYIMDMGTINSDGYILNIKPTFCSEDLLEIGDLIMPKDDIGGGLIIGKTGYIDSNNKYVLGDHVYLIKTKEINPLYLHYEINSKYINKELKKKVTGSAQLGLKASNILNQNIIIYSNEMQNKISNILRFYDVKIKFEASKLEKLGILKKGLMQKMFI